MAVIVLLEVVEHRLHLLAGAQALGEYAFDELPDPVADESRVCLTGMGWESGLLEGMVGGVAEVGDGVEQGAVEVEDDELFHSRWIFSERIAHGEVECRVAVPVGMYQRPRLLSACGVVGLEPEVEAQQEVGEIHAQADSVGGGYLFVERFQAEHSSRLVGIILDGPDVARVDEDRPLEDPEELVAVFEAENQRDVATLVDEVGHAVARVVAARAEGADAPSPDRVGSSGVEPFLKRYHRCVAVGVANAAPGVERY